MSLRPALAAESLAAESLAVEVALGKVKVVKVEVVVLAGMSDREVDGRAVLPQALKLVVGPLLFVLDVDDDVREVDQHPAAVALAFPAHRLDPELAKLVLDVVDDRADLAVVGSGRQNEDVGERELLTDVQSDDLAGQLVLGGCGCSPGRSNGVGRGAPATRRWSRQRCSRSRRGQAGQQDRRSGRQ